MPVYGNDMSSVVSAGEAVDVLKRIARGDLQICGGYDNKHGCFIVGAGGYTLAFFDDAGCVDYLDWMVAPDGRKGDYDSWTSEVSHGPLSALSKADVRRVEELVRAATGALDPGWFSEDVPSSG